MWLCHHCAWCHPDDTLLHSRYEAHGTAHFYVDALQTVSTMPALPGKYGTLSHKRFKAESTVHVYDA